MVWCEVTLTKVAVEQTTLSMTTLFHGERSKSVKLVFPGFLCRCLNFRTPKINTQRLRVWEQRHSGRKGARRDNAKKSQKDVKILVVDKSNSKVGVKWEKKYHSYSENSSLFTLYYSEYLKIKKLN